MIDPAVAEIILGGFLGLTILGVTQILKNFLWKPPAVVPAWGGYLISFGVSAGFVAYYLLTSHTFTWLLAGGYTLYVWAVANGIFKATHTPSATPQA